MTQGVTELFILRYTLISSSTLIRSRMYLALKAISMGLPMSWIGIWSLMLPFSLLAEMVRVSSLKLNLIRLDLASLESSEARSVLDCRSRQLTIAWVV